MTGNRFIVYFLDILVPMSTPKGRGMNRRLYEYLGKGDLVLLCTSVSFQCRLHRAAYRSSLVLAIHGSVSSLLVEFDVHVQAVSSTRINECKASVAVTLRWRCT